MHEALELGRENHVHEQECQPKRDQEIRIRFLEALGLPDELPAVIRRQIERLDVVAQFGDSLSQGLALEVGGDDDLPLPRKPFDGARPLGILEGGDAAEFDDAHARLARRHRQPGDLGGVVPERAVGAEPDVVLLVRLLVFADRIAPHEHVGRR